MVDIAKRKADRLLVMNDIFDSADGSQWTFVDAVQIRDARGFEDREMADICAYLSGEGLIREVADGGSLTPGAVQLTHEGIKEVEQAREEPEQATEHFPPLVSVVQIYGDVRNSNIAAGTVGSEQRRGETQ